MHSREQVFPARDYDLAATLTSGQAFRWQPHDNGWVGVIDRRWVRLEYVNGSIVARVAGPVSDWNWLAHYLQTELDFGAVLSSFPEDKPKRSAVAACRGLRLLPQDPLPCLPPLIISSSHQI